MAKFKYALFYDFHTPVNIPEVGNNFDVEAFTEQIKSCKVDFLTWHARCNQGGAYYDTEVGIKHPALKSDLIREIGESCRRKGITFSVYFNGHLSDEELIAHPEWLAIDKNGVSVNPERGPFARMVCYNSPYREHLRDMALELAEKYPVDGFFFDCLGTFPCVCPTCVREMETNGIDWHNEAEALEFSHHSVNTMCEFLAGAIRGVKADSLLFFNGRPFEEIIQIESHLECECLPTAGWGYETLPVCAHYMRKIAGPEKSVLNMTGRFNDWGDFGGLRTEVGLEYDLFYGVANGMRPNIGGHFHPRGDLDIPVFDKIRQVYRNLQQYDPWVIDAVNKPETALVYPREREMYYPCSEGVKAAVRMLTELKVQFDLVSEFSSWDDYKLLIFPDDVVFTTEIKRRVEKHLNRGGKILASSHSGLDPEKKHFAIPSWPAIYSGDISYDPVYFMPGGTFAKGLPDMVLSLYASGAKVKAAAEAQSEMYYVKPYLTAGWDGMRTNFYNAPQAVTDEPFILRTDNIVYVSGKIFTGYGNRAPIQLRQIVENILNYLVPDPVIRCAGLPSFARAFVQYKAQSCTLVHLLSYCPEKRCNAIALEDRITVLNSKISLRIGNTNIRNVYLAPAKEPLPFEIVNGYCTVTIPQFSGYALVVFDL